jgi:hypothetical protein
MVGAITICALCLLVYGLKHKAAMDAKQAYEAKTTTLVVRGGIWDADDYRHYTRIGDKSATLSNEDFQWLISKLTSNVPPPRGDQADVDTLIILELEDAHLTPSQSAEASKTAIPLLYEEDPHDNVGNIESFACGLLEKCHNKLAVPRLLVLLSSPHVWVQYHAAIALNTMGYKVTVPPRPTNW